MNLPLLFKRTSPITYFLISTVLIGITSLGLIITPPDSVAYAQGTADDASGEDSNLQFAVIVLNTNKLADIKEIKKIIRDSGGKVLSYLPPNILRTKITPETIQILSTNPLIEEMSSDTIQAKKYTKAPEKMRKAIELNNQIQGERKKIKIAGAMKGAGEKPFLDELRPSPESQLSKSERNRIQKQYQAYWKQNKVTIQNSLLSQIGLETASDETSDTSAGSSSSESESTIKAAPSGDSSVVSHAPEDCYWGTSLYLSGEIAVGIFFASGTAGSWPTASIDSVFASTVAAIELYAEDEPNANITIVPIKEVVDGTPKTPPSSPRTYVNDLRYSLGSDWAYTITIYYGDGRAWAYLWGPNHILYSQDLRSGYVTRHEGCHIFGANDQYHPDAGQSPTGSNGYLRIINANSQYNDGTGYNGGAGEGQMDIMINSPGNRIFGVYTRGQLGWFDSDGDGILDVMDTYPKTALSSFPEISSSNRLTLSGYSQDMPELNQYNSAYGDATLNSIEKIEYRINGLSWIEIPSDVLLGDKRDIKNFSLQTPALPNGNYTIEVRAANSVGNVEKVPPSQSTTINQADNPVTTAAPFAAFSVNPPIASVGKTITLDASSSSDLSDDASVLRVRWDTNDDGSFESGWLPIQTPYTTSYGTTGEKTIVMELRNSHSQTSSLAKTITITTNRPPKAFFKLSPENIQGSAGVTVSASLDGTASEDAEDGQNLLVRWQFSPTDSWTSWSSFSAAQQTHSYSSPTFSKHQRIWLEVQDTTSNISRTSRNFWTIGYNHPPVVSDFNITSVSGQGQINSVTYSDPDSSAAWDPWRKARFDLNGDGIWDTRFLSLPLASYKFNAEARTIPITCQVRDAFGATSTLTKTFTFDNIAPRLDPISDKTAIVGSTISFLVTARDLDDDPVTFSLSAVSGASTAMYSAQLTDHGDGTASFNWNTSGATFGEYYFRFRVTDSKGATESQEMMISLELERINVSWVNPVGVSIDGNSITKTTATGWGNSGAASSLSFSGDGGVEFSAPQSTDYAMVGLSASDANASYSSIQFAIYAKAGAVGVYENGTNRGDFGTYRPGATLSVERANNVITYKNDGNTIYTSSITSTGTLIVDTALYNQGVTISAVKIMGTAPMVPNSIIDLGADGEDKEVILTWSAPADNGSAITSYEVQYGTVASGRFATVISGLTSAGTTVTGLTNGIAYQFRVIAKNAIGSSPVSNVAVATPIVKQNVAWTNTEGVNVSGNSITKTATAAWGNAGASSSVKVPADGSLEFTIPDNTVHTMAGFSTSDPNTSYTSIQFAIYAQAGTVAVYESGTSRGTFGTYSAGTTFSVERVGTNIYYKKNGTLFYTSTVTSTGSLLADTALYSQGATISNAKMSGVVLTEPDAITDLGASGESGQVVLTWNAPADNGSAITSYEVQYGTVASGGFATVISGLTTTGRTVTGLTNGIAYQFRVIAKNAIGSSPVSNVVIATPLLKQDVSWANTEGVSVSGNSITKTATTAWGNAGASSSLKIPANGSLEFTATQTTTYAMAGLSTSDANTSYTSIQFAIYAKAGSIAVYESGAKRGDFGSYSAGTTFSVERVGTTIYYKKDGTTFYTSTLTSTGSLLADTALYSQGAIISNAKMITK